MVEIDQWSKPNIEQFAELAMGILPREFHSETELTPQARTVYEAGQRLWPRPTTSEPCEPQEQIAERVKRGQARGNNYGPNTMQKLGTVAVNTTQRLWARPAAGNFNDSETPESFHARRESIKEQGINGNGAGTPLAIQAKETVGRLWARPRAQERQQYNSQDNYVALSLQVKRWGSLTGPHSPTTRTDGEPSSTPDLTSLRLSPLFDEWLLFGARMIGWTCVCPSRVLVRADGALPPSEMQCAQIKPPQPSGHFGSEHSESGRHE